MLLPRHQSCFNSETAIPKVGNFILKSLVTILQCKVCKSYLHFQISLKSHLILKSRKVIPHILDFNKSYAIYIYVHSKKIVNTV